MSFLRAGKGGGGGGFSQRYTSFSGSSDVHISMGFKPKAFAIYCATYNSTRKNLFYYDEALNPDYVYQNFDGSESTRALTQAGGVYIDNDGINIIAEIAAYMNGKLVYVIAY